MLREVAKQSPLGRALCALQLLVQSYAYLYQISTKSVQ
jgi:hypothetical protein